MLALAVQNNVWAEEKSSALGEAKVDAIEVITVNGTAYKKSIKLTPPGEAVISLKEIEVEQATQFAELIDQLPGVNMDGGTRVGGERINMWGFGRQEDVRVFVDNAPIGFEQYRYGSFFVDPDLIKQVEVIKGAHDVRSGNGGFGGSMYVTTKSAADFLKSGEHFGARVKLGHRTNNDEKRYTTSLFGEFNSEWSALAHVTHSDANDTTLADDKKFLYSGYRQNSVLAKVDWDSGPNSLSLSYTNYQDKGRQPWAVRRGKMPTISAYNIKKYGGLANALFAQTVMNTYRDQTYSLNYRFNPQSDLIDTQVLVSTSDNKRHWVRPKIAFEKMFVSLGAFGHESWLDYKRHFVDINNTSLFGEHSLLVGLQYLYLDRDSLVFNKSQAKRENKNFGRYTPYYQPSGKQSTTAIYAKLTYQLTEDLSISPSLRYDHIRSEGKGNLASDYNTPEAGHDYSAVNHSGFSPRVALDYALTQDTNLYFDYAYTLRAPVVDEIYSVQFPRASKAISSSRDLKVERLNAYKFGVTHIEEQLFTDNDTLSTQVTLFYHKGKNDIARRLGASVKPGDRKFEQLQGYYTNLKGYYNKGADLVINYRLADFYVDANFAYIKGEHKGSSLDSTGKDEPLKDLAPANARLKMGYFITEEIELAWQGRWYDRKSEKDLPAKSAFRTNQTSDAYLLQDLYLSYKPTNSVIEGLEGYVTVKNLVDKAYTPFLNNGVPGAGRDIRVGLNYQF
ncbi:TonB-dependent receptor domain-containing protein [Parashewanella tropica]|uniref:TonB-dependent receptor domain-containing protein n=1 Tax=Parashewanella tropica TaxID=2547970 RepID=UPI00105A6FDB|nr:TonB-dependent receptor [Parashewanella tropica]